jgi:amino acid transporter
MSFLSATWTLSGYDVAAHVAEETADAARTVPRAMIWSTWSSTVLGFIYLISLALCATNIDDLINDNLDQPLGSLFAQVLGVNTAVALLAINFVCQFACGVAFVSWHATVSPRLTVSASSWQPRASSSRTVATRRSRATRG